MKKFKGIVFDFNGTIIVDDDYHYLGWMRYAKDLGLTFTEQFYFDNMHGSTNELIGKRLYGGEIPAEVSNGFGLKKEEYYREMFRDNPPPMAKGFLELISFLKERGAEGIILDPRCKMELLEGETRRFESQSGYFSLFALEGEALLSVSGAKYNLSRHPLSPTCPLGVSNEGKGEVTVTVHSGRVLLVRED